MSHGSSDQHRPATVEENVKKVAECFKHPAFVEGLNALLARVAQGENLPLGIQAEQSDAQSQTARPATDQRDKERAISRLAGEQAEGRGESPHPSQKHPASHPVSVFERLGGGRKSGAEAPVRSFRSQGRVKAETVHQSHAPANKSPLPPLDNSNEIVFLKKRIIELESRQPQPSPNSEWLNSQESPLAPAVLAEPLPEKFKVPQIPAYNGETDPNAHLGHYNSWMDLHGSSDAIRCRMFSLTLGERAQRWYRSLPHHSVQTWAHLTAAFRSYFMGSLVRVAPRSSIASVVQGANESLKDYISRFIPGLLNSLHDNTSIVCWVFIILI
ncbi:hypothetical protein OROHE_024904 [Orobanche hederae]